MGHSTPVVIGF